MRKNDFEIEIYDMTTNEYLGRDSAEKVSQTLFNSRALLFSFAHTPNNTIYNSAINRIFKKRVRK